MRVLVADDDSDARVWLVSALHSLGVERVDEAVDGADLLWKLGEASAYDLVITDVHMPLPDGRHVVATARAAGVTTPFVVVSADESTRAEAERAGCECFIHKPIDRHMLARIVLRVRNQEVDRTGSSPSTSSLCAETVPHVDH